MLVNANEKDFMNLMFRWEVDGPAAHQGASADPSVLFIEVRAPRPPNPLTVPHLATLPP